MKAILFALVAVFFTSCATAQTIYRLDGNDIGQEEFWTTQNLTNLTNRLSASSLTINPGRIGIPPMSGQASKGLSTNGTVFQWTSFQPLSSELTTMATNGSVFYLNRANHTGTQLLATIRDAGALAALNVVSIGQLDASVYSLGGNGVADSGKLVQMQGNGEITATKTLTVMALAGNSYGQLQPDNLTFQNIGGTPGRFYTLALPAITGSRFLYLPSSSGTIALLADITLANLPQTGATNGQGIVWNGSNWAPGTVGGSLVMGTTPSDGSNGNVLYTTGNTVQQYTVVPSTEGGTGINNAGTLTNASNTTITGGGTITLGGFTLTVPATGTAALRDVVNTFTAANTIQKTSLGTTSTPALTLTNSTAATVGAQQMSPSLTFVGQGWKTNSTAASQTVSWRQEVLPVQGAASPSATWKLQGTVNGADMAYPQIQARTNAPAIITGVSGVQGCLVLNHPDAYIGDGAFFAVGGAGNLFWSGPFQVGGWLQIQASSGGNENVTLYCEPVGDVLSLRKGTTAQRFNVFGTYTDINNYEGLSFITQAGDYTIAPQAAGTTSTLRNLVLGAVGSLTSLAGPVTQLGASVNGDAVDQTVKAADGVTGANRSGGDLNLASGNSTGAGSSAVIFKVPVPTTSGSTATTAVERGRVDNTGIKVGGITVWGDATTSPESLPPTNTFYLYVDPADGKLKVLAGASGTITIIANP